MRDSYKTYPIDYASINDYPLDCASYKKLKMI